MKQDDKEIQDGVNMSVPPHRHSKVITGMRTLDDSLHWRYNTRNLYPHEDESIEVRFFLLMKDTPAPQKSEALKILLKEMKNTEVSWLIPGRDEWTFDLDRMKNEFEDLQELDWCKGRVHVDPEFKVKNEITDVTNKKYYETFVIFYI